MKTFALIFLALFSITAIARGGNGHANYTFPVVEEELKPFATFPLPHLNKDFRGDHARLRYELPQELTGVPMRIELEGQWDEATQKFVLAGDHGKATCDQEMCDIKYENLNLNPETVDAYLRGVSKNPTELDSRMKIARRFDGDPFGVIDFNP